MKVYVCKQRHGTLFYDGPMSARMKRILKYEQWDRLKKIETIHFGCDR